MESLIKPALITAIFTAVAGICASAATILSFISLRNMVRQHKQIIKLEKSRIKSDISLRCCNLYLDILTKEAEAYQKKEISYAYDSQRALIDLVWFEYQLYKRKHIEHEDFKAWLLLKRKNYTNEVPSFEFNLSEITIPKHLIRYVKTKKKEDIIEISYTKVWDYLKEIGYYSDHNDFLELMEKVHKSNEEIGFVLESIKHKEML